MARIVVVISTLVLLLALPASALGAAPSNDNFANAKVIAPGSLPYSDTVNPTDATVQGGDPIGTCGSQMKATVWYRLTPSSTGTYRADTIGSDYDTRLDVFQGTTLGGLALVECNSDIDSENPDLYTSRAAFHGKAGVRYYIRLATQDNSGTTGTTLKFHLVKVATVSNDSYKNSTRISSLPFSTNADDTNATSQPNEPRQSLVCLDQRATRWYKYTPATTQVIWAYTLVAIDFDTVLGVYTGSTISNATQVTCSDDQSVGGAHTLSSGITFKAIAGTTYHFQVGGYDAESGGYGELPFHVRQIDANSNDDIGAATTISSIQFKSRETLRRATFQAGEPVGACLDQPANSAWYRYTAPSGTALRAMVDGVFGSYNPEVSVYQSATASFGSLVAVGCGTQLDFVPISGQTYWFQVSADRAEADFFDFSLLLDPDP